MSEYDFWGFEKESEPTSRNSVLTSKDEIALVDEKDNNEVKESITDIRSNVNAPSVGPKGETVLEEPKPDTEVQIEEIEEMDEVPSINEDLVNAERAYKAYMEVLKKLPDNLLDDINHSYMTLERGISAIPKDILLKFVKSFEEITEEDIKRAAPAA